MHNNLIHEPTIFSRVSDVNTKQLNLFLLIDQNYIFIYTSVKLNFYRSFLRNSANLFWRHLSIICYGVTNVTQIDIEPFIQNSFIQEKPDKEALILQRVYMCSTSK